MELYLLQGLAMLILRSKWVYIQNDLLYCVAVLALDVAMSVVVHIALNGLPDKNRTR